MQAANDWFSSGQWLTCGAAKTAISVHSAADEQDDQEDDYYYCDWETAGSAEEESVQSEAEEEPQGVVKFVKASK